jgi:hypothetical protein
MNIKDIQDQEVRMFVEAQMNTIMELNKKVMKLEMERKALESKMSNMVISTPQINPDLFDITDEETICLTQIALLRGLALQRELTTEESKRFEVYHKVMNNLRGKKPEERPDFSAVDTDNLLKMIEVDKV